MQRRDFLSLLGMSAAAAAVSPSVLVHAATPSPILRQTYAVYDELGYWVTAFVLNAPAHQRCRAEILMPATAPLTLAAHVTGVASGNDIGQVVIERVGAATAAAACSTLDTEQLSQLAAEIDAAVFNTDYMYCPVDWGAVSRGHPLEIDYQAIGHEDRTLLLALFYNVVDRTDTRPPWNRPMLIPHQHLIPTGTVIHPTNLFRSR